MGAWTSANAGADAGADPKPQLQPLPREIEADELTFLGEWTREGDLATLRQHVHNTWSDAMHTSDHTNLYRCVRELFFLEPRIKRNPFGAAALERLRAEKHQLWLDVGCGVGTDIRWVVQQLLLQGEGQGHGPGDGAASVSQRLTALDVTTELWEFGMRLYKDQEPPCEFVHGNLIESEDALGMQNKFSVVSAISVLHVLDEQGVRQLVEKVPIVLQPNGMFFGSTLGAAEPCEWTFPQAAGSSTRWLHSVSSLKLLLESVGFVDVEVSAIPMNTIVAASSRIMQDAPWAIEKIMMSFKGIKP